MPVTIPVTLPDELAEQAKIKGLLSSTALALIIGEAVKKDEPAREPFFPKSFDPFPSDMDPRLEGAVNPPAYKRGKITGDVVTPLDIPWEANS